MVVIDQRDALIGGESRQRLDALGKAGPLGFAEHRLFGQRLAVFAMDGVRGLADDDHLRANRLQEVEKGLHRLLLGLDVVHQKIGRMPARHIAKAALPKLLLDAFGRVGQLVTLLDPVEADLGRFVEALLQGDMGAERAIVVIRPGDGVGAVKDHRRAFS